MRRTVPFFHSNENERAPPSLLIDDVLLRPGMNPGSAFFSKLAASLSIGSIAPFVPAEVAESLVEGQYGAALEALDRHSIWASIQDGEGDIPLAAYVLEARHYLHAAAWRMAPGAIAAGQTGKAARILLTHLLEEHDHAGFFERALELWGCSAPAVRALRCSPVTREWIQLMRTLGARDGLTAALISGLLESTATNRPRIHQWHDMLVRRDYLPATAANSMRAHVAVDESLGHGENWRRYLRQTPRISTESLCNALNAVAAVAEMLLRWFTSLELGITGRLRRQLQAIRPPGDAPKDTMFRGFPVWSAAILCRITRSPDTGGNVDSAVALAFHCPAELLRARSALQAQALRIRGAMSTESSDSSTASELEKSLTAWMTSINGHLLWSELLARPSLALLWGWMHETYFFLASARRHLPAAIATCTDVEVRSWLLRHLEEESDHCEMLAPALASVRGAWPLHRSRPLPTTIAFTGYLEELGTTDWRAHALAVAYLQLTFRPRDRRHSGFYERVLAKCPDGSKLIGAMKTHDFEDTKLGHGPVTRGLLRLLAKDPAATNRSMAHASLVPQFAWGFLDGILSHFRHGMAGVAQRLGWEA